MSWSEALRRSLLVGFLTCITGTLAACSFSPVYSGARATQPGLDLAYAKPNSRLEQVVYQELSLRFGSSPSPMADVATVTVASSAADMLLTTTTNPAKPVSVTVTATLIITDPDDSDSEPVSFVRTASAEYTRSGQILADSAAASDAAERAARAAAESLRLAVLATISR